jgi:hypothetical protein
MTRGEDVEESRIQSKMFGDFYLQTRCVLKQMELEQAEGNLIMQTKETNKTLAQVI